MSGRRQFFRMGLHRCPVEQQFLTFAGWGMAFWGPIILVTMEGIRADD